ncbi:MAG: DUF5678 domain-containing protein [Patescibacteria group bacterium]
MKNHSQINQNFTKVHQDFAGKWVAVSDDYATVLASGETLDQVLKNPKAETRDSKIFKVIPLDQIYSPIQA